MRGVYHMLATPLDERGRVDAGAASPLPIVVQDEPAATGVTMPPSFLAALGFRLVQLEEAPVPHKLSRILERNPEARVFGGLGGLHFLQELERGAVGTMTGFACTEGRGEQARDTYYRYLPLISYEGQAGAGLAIRKEILRRRGAIRCPAIRAPGIRLDAAGQEELTRVLARVGLP